METQAENIIQNLKHLLSICNDGKEGYINAADNVDAPELKSLLGTYAIQRTEYASSLKSAIIQAGGDPDNDDGGPLGMLHRAWIDVKTVFTSNDNKAVLEAVVTGEKAAIEAYDHALIDANLTSAQRQLLSSQRQGIQESLSNIENLEHQYA